MCDIPNDTAMDGNLGETLAIDTREAEKVHALQPEPSMGEGVHGTTVAGASQASQSPSGVIRKMGSIKDLASVLAIANDVELRRTKVNRKALVIYRCMEYGQSRIIGWDHMAKVKEDLLAHPLEGRLQLVVWDDKGMGMPLRNWINVTGYFACPACHAVVFSGSSVGDRRLTRRCSV